MVLEGNKFQKTKMVTRGDKISKFMTLHLLSAWMHQDFLELLKAVEFSKLLVIVELDENCVEEPEWKENDKTNFKKLINSHLQIHIQQIWLHFLEFVPLLILKKTIRANNH